MQCYLCAMGRHPNGTLLDVAPAVGVCQNCGIGVCHHHGVKGSAPGAPLLCAPCADWRVHARDLGATAASFGSRDRVTAGA